MLKTVSFRGHVIATIDHDHETVTFNLKAPSGFPEDVWRTELIALSSDLTRAVARGDRKCQLYDFKKKKFVEPMLI